MTQLTGQTEIAPALQRGTDELLAGDRPEAPNVLVLLTDGKADDPVATTNTAARIRQSGTQIFAIGVQSAIGGPDTNQLKIIASDPDETHIFFVNIDVLTRGIAHTDDKNLRARGADLGGGVPGLSRIVGLAVRQ